MSTAPLGGVEPVFDLPDRMRKALSVADVSAQDMAAYLDVSRNTISNWINGRFHPPTSALRLWAMRTGVSYAWLRTGETQRPEDDGPGSGAMLPRLDSNQKPAGSEARTAGYPMRLPVAA